MQSPVEVKATPPARSPSRSVQPLRPRPSICSAARGARQRPTGPAE